jgi:crotonobetainyl-CoA:carnitine CoA-transferase CaiB-like acyl-CoA transferase
MVNEFEYPRAGQVKTITLPVKYSLMPGESGRPAPLHREHSRAILGDGLPRSSP